MCRTAPPNVDAPTTTDLQYGVSAVQGPRELMEDCASVVPNGKCGYLYACTRSTHNFHIDCAFHRVDHHLCHTVVFDGHSGFAAAEWLRDNMYGVICDVVNEDTLGSTDQAPGACP